MAAAVALMIVAGSGAAIAAEDNDCPQALLDISRVIPVEVEVRCTLETPGNGAFAAASVRVTMYDPSTDEPIFSFTQPVGRTGAATDPPAFPPVDHNAEIEEEQIVPPGVVCGPVIGCTPGVDAPTDVHVWGTILPGGSSTEVATLGGGGTLEIGETCFNSKGTCDDDGSGGGGDFVHFGGITWEPSE